MQESKHKAHIIWGVMLTVVGLGVFYRIPQVLPKIAEIELFANNLTWVKICFYVLGVLLVIGGTRKIVENYRLLKKDNPPQ